MASSSSSSPSSSSSAGPEATIMTAGSFCLRAREILSRDLPSPSTGGDAVLADTNRVKRELHAEMELRLRRRTERRRRRQMKREREGADAHQGPGQEQENEDDEEEEEEDDDDTVQELLGQLREKLRLGCVRRGHMANFVGDDTGREGETGATPPVGALRRAVALLQVVLHRVDAVVRFCAVNALLMTLAVFAALPLLALDQMDNVLARLSRVEAVRRALPFVFPRPLTAFDRFTETIKHAIVQWVLACSGIAVYTQNFRKEALEGQWNVGMFSHASNIDGFAIVAALPLAFLAPGKTDIFLLPFFSWLALAYGCSPIDRKNRDRAVRTLRRMVNSASSGDTEKDAGIILVAPEGTRSKTGQITDFKKGPFYMQRDAKCGVLPILILGAFELNPPRDFMNETGRVVVRFLEHIPYEEARKYTRDELSAIVRERMLQSTLQPAELAFSPLSWSERIHCLLALVDVGCIVILLYVGFYQLVDYLGITPQKLLFGFLLSSIGLTLLLYFYNVHLVHLLARPDPPSASSSPATTSSAKSSPSSTPSSATSRKKPTDTAD